MPGAFSLSRRSLDHQVSHPSPFKASRRPGRSQGGDRFHGPATIGDSRDLARGFRRRPHLRWHRTTVRIARPKPPAPVPATPPSGDSSTDTSIPEDLKLPPAPVEAGETIDEPASRPAANADNAGESGQRTVKSTPAKPKATRRRSRRSPRRNDPPRAARSGNR